MPTMDYTLLRGRIRDCGMTQKELAEKAGISEGQLCQKLAGNFAFRQDEIDRICALLSISPNLCRATSLDWPATRWASSMMIKSQPLLMME